MKAKSIKKSLFILLTFLIVGGFFGYKYVYKEHRNIESEEAVFTTSVAEVFNEFQENDSIARKKYADKTIIFQGIITAIDTNSKSIVLDSKLNVIFQENNPILLPNQNIKVKGRFVGYDDLLAELQMDQSTIIP